MLSTPDSSSSRLTSSFEARRLLVRACPTRAYSPRAVMLKNSNETLQHSEAAVRLISIMGVAKYSLAAGLSLILTVGLLCSQICAFNCSLYGCALSSPTRDSASHDEHAACHQHKENKAPQKHNGSHQCAGHFDALALGSSGNSANTFHQIPSAHIPITEPALFFNASAKRLVVQSGRKSDRSPPPHSVLRI